MSGSCEPVVLSQSGTRGESKCWETGHKRYENCICKRSPAYEMPTITIANKMLFDWDPCLSLQCWLTSVSHSYYSHYHVFLGAFWWTLYYLLVAYLQCSRLPHSPSHHWGEEVLFCVYFIQLWSSYALEVFSVGKFFVVVKVEQMYYYRDSLTAGNSSNLAGVLSCISLCLVNTLLLQVKWFATVSCAQGIRRDVT